MLDFYRLKRHGTCQSEHDANHFVFWDLPSGGGFYMPQPRQHPRHYQSGNNFINYDESESDNENDDDESGTADNDNTNNDAEGDGYGNR
jgi:hypothetical protein